MKSTSKPCGLSREGFVNAFYSLVQASAASARLRNYLQQDKKTDYIPLLEMVDYSFDAALSVLNEAMGNPGKDGDPKADSWIDWFFFDKFCALNEYFYQLKSTEVELSASETDTIDVHGHEYRPSNAADLYDMIIKEYFTGSTEIIEGNKESEGTTNDSNPS